MPALPKTSTALVVAAARKLIDKHGLEPLSMQAVAAAVGVSAPSLYKRFADRSALVGAVLEELLVDLRRRVQVAATVGRPADDLRAMVNALRAYAHRHPHLYALVFERADRPPATARYAEMVEPMLERLRELGDPARALDGARLLTAFTHGFLSMELAGAFHLGGDTDEAFAFGIDRILAALSTRRGTR